ncbi:MAG: MarR family winged helix-turn-helix transcriptional regulator [Hyphomonadaceae bacterium]
MKPRGPLRLADYLPYRLSIASNEVSRLIAESYEARFGLRIAEWRVLAVLAEFHAHTQAEIVAKTAMDKVTVSRAVHALTARDLVARSSNAADGRSQIVALTRAGQRLFEEIAPLAHEYESRLLEGFSGVEVETLKALLTRLETRARLARAG